MADNIFVVLFHSMYDTLAKEKIFQAFLYQINIYRHLRDGHHNHEDRLSQIYPTNELKTPSVIFS
jgi:hypothetical protein